MKSTFGNSIVGYLAKEKNYSIIEIQGIGTDENIWCAKNIIDGRDTYLIFLERENISNALLYRNAILQNVESMDIDINLVFVTNTDKEFNTQVRELIDKGLNGGVFTVSSGGNVYRMNNGIKYIYDDLTEASKRILKSNSKGIKGVFELLKDNKATAAFMAINILMFIISVVASQSKSVMNIDMRTLLVLGANNKLLVFEAGEYQRIIASMFLHGGLLHIMFNMYALYIMGPLVERIYGSLNFIAIYIVSGLTSSMLSLILSDPSVISVGASGCIFGLLGAALVYGVKMRGTIGKQFMGNILQVVAINVFIGFTIPNIDNYAHLGGFIGGLLISFVFSYFKRS